MCSDHFLRRPRTSHNQILNKSGKREQAYVTEERGKGRHRPPLSPSDDRKQREVPVGCTNAQKAHFAVKGKKVQRQPAPSVPPEIISLIQFLSSIYLRLMIRPGDYLHHLPRPRIFLLLCSFFFLFIKRQQFYLVHFCNDLSPLFHMLAVCPYLS